MPLKVFFDGGCRPNPGTMEIAVVARGVATILSDLGQGSSMEAEWLALIHAATIARTFGPAPVVLLGDALDVVAKANGTLRCDPAGAPHLARFREIAAGGPPLRVRHVRRAQNLAGIALARRHPR
jgi:ribonuclease HI